MKPINAPKLNDAILQFVKDRDWDQFHSLKNLTMALSVESSELLEIFQWMKEENCQTLSPEDKSRVQEELADIFFYLLRISDKAGIDLEEALTQKMIKNAAKYPVEKSRGNSKKYDQL